MNDTNTVVKGEEAVIKITEMVKGNGNDMVGLIKTIRESYDLIDQVPDGPARAQAQEHLARELSKLDPSVLREFFERDLPPKIEQSHLKPQLLNALSQDKIHEIFQKSEERMKAYRAESRTRLGELRKMLKDEIDAVLTPEQRAKNDEMIRRFEEWRKKESDRNPTRDRREQDALPPPVREK